jgi:hypothetical protein
MIHLAVPEKITITATTAPANMTKLIAKPARPGRELLTGSPIYRLYELVFHLQRETSV